MTVSAAKTFDVLDRRVFTPSPEYTLDRAHHQQPGTIKNPSATVVRQSVLDVFVYLDTPAELTPSRNTRGHYGPVSQACQRTGKGDLAGSQAWL